MSPTLVDSRSVRPLFTRDRVAEKICNGAVLVIYKAQLINATKWAPSHPGGALALLHFVGRDATDEIDAYHSEPAKKRMERMVVGRVDVNEEEGWKPLTPPIALGLVQHQDGQPGHWMREGQVRLADGKVEGNVSSDVITLTPEQLEPLDTGLNRRTEQLRSKAYRDLRKRITEAGLFDRPGPLSGYGSDIVRYTGLGAAAFGLFFL